MKTFRCWETSNKNEDCQLVSWIDMLQVYLPTEYPRLRALKEWLEHAEADDTVILEG